MKDERYMSWFRQVVEMGWTCGVFHPQEILTNYLLSFYQFSPYSEPLPYDHIERFMIDTTQHDFMLPDRQRPSLQKAVKHFNLFYEDRRIDFGVYTRLGIKDASA